MSLALKILVGLFIGFIFGFFSILKTINYKEKNLEAVYASLVSRLEFRYLNLKKLLNLLSSYMKQENEQSKISEIIYLCDNSIEASSHPKDVLNKIEFENKINLLLEDIKANMSDYTFIQDDENINNVIFSVAQSEAYVGETIRVYNDLCLEYKMFLEMFPISVIASILGKNSNVVQFLVSKKEEFGDDYVYEDEI